MTADTFAAGLHDAGAPPVLKATATPIEGVFLVTFERGLTMVEGERLRRAGFALMRHKERDTYYQIRWEETEK